MPTGCPGPPRTPRPVRCSRFGPHQSADSLDLKSGVALVLDQDTNEVLFSKNSEAILPIASLTKLMTAVVVTDVGELRATVAPNGLGQVVPPPRC